MYDFGFKLQVCMSRDLIVIGNWKMHKTAREAIQAIEQLVPNIQGYSARVLLALPFTAIAPAAFALKQTNIWIGAQNMHDAREGAFTGEISSLMLKEAGARFVLLGHSERRQLFGETDEWIGRKIVRALQDDLQVIFCVGETLEEREEGRTEEVLQRQIRVGLELVPKEQAKNIMLAYEPVWAIGSGKSATPKLAEEVHAFCRKCLREQFGKAKADLIPILYGGSVKPDNVKQLVLQKEIDGVLVGGASLDPEVFAQIIQHCEGIR